MLLVSTSTFYFRTFNHFVWSNPFFRHHVVVQVAQVARTFRVFFSKAKTGEGQEDYLVDHRPVLVFAQLF